MSEEHLKDRVRAQFGGSSAAYAMSKTHRSGNDLDRLVELAECRPDVDALDVATGAGHTARAIAPHVSHVVASDLTPEMLDTARAEMQSAGIHNISYRVADAENLPFESTVFDLVTCRIAPHHFSDVRQAVSEVARVLRPGGLFMLIDSTSPDDSLLGDFINELDRRRDSTHVRSYPRREWEQMLTDAGFQVEGAEGFPKTHDFADWTARSRMSDQDREELERWVLESPANCLEHFRIVANYGRVISFTDTKTLFKCRKI